MASEASSRSTKVKKCHGETTDLGSGGKDRISSLPDAILGDILWPFSTKEAVRTSVLSKRWRNVWTSVPCIDIDDGLLLSENNLTIFKTVEFVDFVDRVLHLNHVFPLNKIWFSWSKDYSLSHFSEWLSSVAIRDAEDVDLEYVGLLRIEFPPCSFTCKKLVILKLKNFFLNVPQSAFLPCLKVLHLYLIQFFDDNSMKNFLAGCPVLEELEMKRYYDDNAETLHIQSSSLKRLTLEISASSDQNLGIILDAKNLEQIDLTDYVIKKIDVINVSSVVSVSLDVDQENTAVELLKNMCKAKYLNVSFSTVQSLELAPLNNLPVFRHLTHLVVEIIRSSWAVFPHLLECSPNLVTFEFIQEFSKDVDEVEFRAPKGLMLHLESVNIFGFDWSKNEIEMASYFLEKATVLKKMYIYPNPRHFTHEYSNLCKELCLLPKSSTACELDIVSYNCSVEEVFPF